VYFTAINLSIGLPDCLVTVAHAMIHKMLSASTTFIAIPLLQEYADERTLRLL